MRWPCVLSIASEDLSRLKSVTNTETVVTSPFHSLRLAPGSPLQAARYADSRRSPSFHADRSVNLQSQPPRTHLPECIPARPHHAAPQRAATRVRSEPTPLDPSVDPLGKLHHAPTNPTATRGKHFSCAL